MTALRMALSELRRLTAGRLPKLAVVALLLVPVLYGGLYLYANHDPYGRLNKIPTAVVVEAEGTTLATGEKLNVGPQVADELEKSKSFTRATGAGSSHASCVFGMLSSEVRYR